MKKQLDKNFLDIVGVENLILAWTEFVKGKRGKRNVQEFVFNLMDNILLLHENLINKTYEHDSYKSFNISDPKPRNIHKATVRDRLLHHAIHRVLYLFFDKAFIADSFSCRIGKGTHKALNRLRSFGYKVSQNNTRTCWVLKCDIKKFFANIDHKILIDILRQYIPDENIIWLLREIIGSFRTNGTPQLNNVPQSCNICYKIEAIGLPLGNLTSQLLVNIYMNEFDQFVKHKLKAKYYIRYADDFVILSENKNWLEKQIPKIRDFLRSKLKLELHENKVFIKTLASGIDFLGWVHFPDHRVLRTTTKRRMIKRIKEHPTPETINSYLGLLKHGNTYKIKRNLEILLEKK